MCCMHLIFFFIIINIFYNSTWSSFYEERNQDLLCMCRVKISPRFILAKLYLILNGRFQFGANQNSFNLNKQETNSKIIQIWDRSFSTNIEENHTRGEKSSSMQNVNIIIISKFRRLGEFGSLHSVSASQ